MTKLKFPSDPNGKTNTTSTLISNGQESRSESNHHWPSYDYLQQQYLVLSKLS